MFKVTLEWSTTDDDRTCRSCKTMEGRVITLNQARGLILHTSCIREDGCRCTLILRFEPKAADQLAAVFGNASSAAT